MDYCTRRRTELADEREPARMANQISDFRQTGGSAGTEQTGDRFRETRFEPDWRFETFRAIRIFAISNRIESARRAGRAQGSAA
jgi:hypothetical protein